MSGSESQPRKVKLMRIHSKVQLLPWVFTHNNTACKYPYWNNLATLIYSLVNGLYKIITESIKLVLDVEQFGQVVIWTSLPRMYRKCHIFLLFYAPSLRHSIHSIEIPMNIFQPIIHLVSKTSVNNFMLLALPTA